MRVVVTGAGSGFGRAIARRLLARGDRVLATELVVDGLAERLGSGLDAGDRLEVVGLDVRDPGLVADLAGRAGDPVDGLVNNAGYGLFASQADGDPAAATALFDTNVLGPARVTQALLPALRAARGTVVQLSSVAGRMVFPESGFYAASKHALEALSEALYIENAAHGVRVAVVEPGAFATGFSERASRSSGPRRPDSAHAASFPLWDRRKDAALAPSPQDPERVADAVLASLDGGPPFQRRRVGTDTERLLALRDVLGEDAWVRFMGVRVGGPDADTGVATPAQVLAASPDALGGRAFAGARAALRAGLLDHWDDLPGGAQARARLAGA